MSTKQIPVILVVGMLLALLLLGGTYFLKSMHVLDNFSSSPKVKGFAAFFPPTEVGVLQITPTPVDVYRVKVFMFSNDKFSQPGTSDYTTPVERQTSRVDIATYAVEQILRGPSIEEVEQGLRPTFGEDNFMVISGKSSCGIKNFTVDLDPENYFATLHFCKDIAFLEDVSINLLTDQIRNTLIGFEKIHKIRILNNEGKCIDGSEVLTAEDCVY